MISAASAKAIQGPGVASALRASRSMRRNNASGTARTTTKYFAHSETPTARPSHTQSMVRPCLSPA